MSKYYDIPVRNDGGDGATHSEMISRCIERPRYVPSAPVVTDARPYKRATPITPDFEYYLKLNEVVSHVANPNGVEGKPITTTDCRGNYGGTYVV